MKRNMLIKKFLCFAISVLLTNSVTVFADTKSTGNIDSLPEYQIGFDSLSSVQENVSDEEKEKLLDKHSNEKDPETKFKNAKAQLEEDGYRVIQDSYNKDAWIVEKKINGTTTCLTVYPFNENGECTMNVEAIEGLFNVYEALKSEGYSISCSGKTDLYYYFSLGKGQYFEQIATGLWTISKDDGSSVKMLPFGNDGKLAISVKNVEQTFKNEAAISQLKGDGYSVELQYNSDTHTNYWTVSKKINKTNVSMDVYEFNVENIENLFNAYESLTNAGYSVKCTDNLNYSYLQNGKIGGTLWTISNGTDSIYLGAFDDNGNLAVSLNNVNRIFSLKASEAQFREAQLQLQKDGYKVVQDAYQKDAWIVRKEINGTTTCLTVYPFNENGECTMNVESIEGLFNVYEALKSEGYSVSCSGKTELYYYFSIGKGQYFEQITANLWTISKDGKSVDMLPFGNDGKLAISIKNVEQAFKNEAAISQLKGDGYSVELQYDNDTYTNYWTVSKKINKSNVSMDVYEFNVETIENLFKAYESLTDTGYSVKCMDSRNYSYLENGKIGGTLWTISNGTDSIYLGAFDDNGNLAVSLNNVNKMFTAKQEQAKFETAKAQLQKDGYKVVQDAYQKDAWIVRKEINGTTTCLTVYPFDNDGKSTINVKNIEGLFNAYSKLKSAGYSIDCSGKTELYYYFSIGKGQYFEQITANNWSIKKDGQTLKLAAIDNNKVAINTTYVNRAFSIVKNLNGKTLSNYKYTAKLSGSNIVISRTKNSSTQSFKLDLNNNFGNQVLAKYNSASKINSNFAAIRTAATTYNTLLTTISTLKSKINTNISKLKSSDITQSVLKNIKDRQKVINNLVSEISSAVSSLKGFFNDTTYKSLTSLVNNLTTKTNTLSTKVSALSVTTVKKQKTNIINQYTALKKLLTGTLDNLI